MKTFRFLLSMMLLILSTIDIHGKPVDKQEVKDKYSFKEIAEKAEDDKVKVGNVFIVDAKEMVVRSSKDEADTTVSILTSGDTIRVLAKFEKHWVKILFKEDRIGYLKQSNILSNAYPEGASVLKFRIKRWIGNLFDLSRLNSWFIIGVFAVILVFVVIYFRQLDNFLLRLRVNHDQNADGGSKTNAYKPRRQNFLNRIYPVKRWPFYPLLSGVLLGITFVIGAFWNSGEVEWFFNVGFNILPVGYDQPIHWFLYISCLLNLLLILSWVVESFVLGGPFVGLLRIAILFILNVMSFLVTFCLVLLVAALIIGLFVLKGLASSRTRRVYYYD